MTSTSIRSVTEEGFSRDSLYIVDPEQSSTFSSNDEETDDDQGGDYSTRMEELLSDEDENGDAEADENDGGFVYDGVDAEQVTGDNYRDQLREVLGPDDSYYESEEQEVERSLLQDSNSVKSDEPFHDVPVSSSTTSWRTHVLMHVCTVQHIHIQPDVSALISDALTMSSVPPSRVASPVPIGPFAPFSKPFLHPNVSRLRSFTPRGSPVPSGSPAQAMSSFSPSPSHFSEISRTSSPSTAGLKGLLIDQEREVFRWSSLRGAGSHLYHQKPAKASSILGDPVLGAPMVLTANGFICVGTDKGRVLVFDFKQTLKCICGSDSLGSSKLIHLSFII